MDAGLREDEAVKRILNFLEHYKLGKVTAGETIRMKDQAILKKIIPIESLAGAWDDEMDRVMEEVKDLWKAWKL